MKFNYGKFAEFHPLLNNLQLPDTNQTLLQRFPAENIAALLLELTDALSDPLQKSVFVACVPRVARITPLLKDTVLLYTQGKLHGVPGSERVFLCFLSMR